jgi:hypothetical protein
MEESEESVPILEDTYGPECRYPGIGMCSNNYTIKLVSNGNWEVLCCEEHKALVIKHYPWNTFTEELL